MKKIFGAIAVLIALSACSESDGTMSVSWYKGHDTERRATLEACSRNGVPTSLECVNARKADDSLNLARRGYVKPKPVNFEKEG